MKIDRVIDKLIELEQREEEIYLKNRRRQGKPDYSMTIDDLYSFRELIIDRQAPIKEFLEKQHLDTLIKLTIFLEFGRDDYFILHRRNRFKEDRRIDHAKELDLKRMKRDLKLICKDAFKVKFTRKKYIQDLLLHDMTYLRRFLKALSYLDLIDINVEDPVEEWISHLSQQTSLPTPQNEDMDVQLENVDDMDYDPEHESD